MSKNSFGKTWWGQQFLNSLNDIDYDNRLPRGRSYANNGSVQSIKIKDNRAYRIGQKNNVMVHRFITKNTFEEKINEMIQKKKDLANMTVATGENWIRDLSNKELRQIFELN